MGTRDKKNDLVTNSKESFTSHREERLSFSDENTDCHDSPPPPIHTEKNKSKCESCLQQHMTDRGGSVWHVASQEVNHDWLTMMVPGSAAGHWLA